MKWNVRSPPKNSIGLISKFVITNKKGGELNYYILNFLNDKFLETHFLSCYITSPKVVGSQGLKYLLSGPLEKKCTDLCPRPLELDLGSRHLCAGLGWILPGRWTSCFLNYVPTGTWPSFLFFFQPWACVMGSTWTLKTQRSFKRTQGASGRVWSSLRDPGKGCVSHRLSL